MQPTRALLAKDNLLLCLDAFGTLFKPARPIAEIYAEVAAKHGVATGGAKNAQFYEDKFRRAFKGETSRNPNYGKATGLGAQKWWRNVIHNTFSQTLRPEQKLPPELADELYQSFATNEPYTLYPDVKEFFLELQKYKATGTIGSIPWRFKRIIVGIITNSDDRVPSVLKSFGLQVGPRRADSVSHAATQTLPQNDIEFVVLSYDVGHEKPDSRIFNAATSVFEKTLIELGEGLNINDFEKLHVGDDLEKDYLGALEAGWHSVLLDRKDVMKMVDRFRFGKVGTKDTEGKERKVLMARSLLHLGMWEPKLPPKFGKPGAER